MKVILWNLLYCLQGLAFTPLIKIGRTWDLEPQNGCDYRARVMESWLRETQSNILLAEQAARYPR